jgi:solute carrier family 41
MRQVDELIIIIPVILNLKGNLEMNLSARLGTAANVGELDKVDVQRSVIYGNLLLLQVQATVVSFVATCVSFIIGLAVPDPVQSTRPDARGTITSTTHPLLRGLYSGHRRAPYIPVKGKDGTQKSGVRGYVSLLFYGDLILFDMSRFLMVASTSMTAACLSSLFLGSLMCCIVLLCRRFGRDPGRLCTPPPIPPSDQIILFPRHADNIAPPIASCLGDLITLSFVGLVSTLLIPVINTPIPSVLGVVVILSAVACLTFTLRNPLVRHLLREGWSPLFGAMVIEVATGIVLDLFVHRYEGFAILAVAISSALSRLEFWTFISTLLMASLCRPPGQCRFNIGVATIDGPSCCSLVYLTAQKLPQTQREASHDDTVTCHSTSADYFSCRLACGRMAEFATAFHGMGSVLLFLRCELCMSRSFEEPSH